MFRVYWLLGSKWVNGAVRDILRMVSIARKISLDVTPLEITKKKLFIHTQYTYTLMDRTVNMTANAAFSNSKEVHVGQMDEQLSAHIYTSKIGGKKIQICTILTNYQQIKQILLL